MAGSDNPITPAQVRKFWTVRHGLGRPVAKRPDAVVAKSGWLRTLGGIDAYLGLRARCPGVTRKTIDGAIAKGRLRVVPAVRGCIYLVPEAQVPPLMALAGSLARPRTERDLDKAGATWKEVHATADAIAEVLADGAKTTDEVRAALPKGAVRSLGAKGKRVGLSSVLPVALRELEFDGRVQRQLVGNALDTERYTWALSPNAETAEANIAEVVTMVLSFAGPMTVKELSTFVGVPQRDIKQALEDMDATTVEVEGWSAPGFIGKKDARSIGDASLEPGWRLLPYQDTLLSMHGGPAPFVAPEHHDLKVKVWGGRGGPVALRDANHLGHRPLMYGDALVGFWEWDPDSERVVVGTLDAPPRGTKKALADEAAAVSAFIRDELGHGRAFSLDTDDGLRERAAWVRKLAYSK